MKARFIDAKDGDQILQTSLGQYRNTPQGPHYNTLEEAEEHRQSDLEVARRLEEPLTW